MSSRSELAVAAGAPRVQRARRRHGERVAPARGDRADGAAAEGARRQRQRRVDARREPARQPEVLDARDVGRRCADSRHLGEPRLGAADVLHDFYVKVLARVGDVRDTEKLRAWMRRVLETTLVDYYRAQGKKRQRDAEYHYLESVLLTGEAKSDLDLFVCVCLYKLLRNLD